MKASLALGILLVLATAGYADAPPAAAPAVAPPDAQAVAAVRELGGNVMPVAQNDPRLDVTLHLADKEVKDEHLATVAKLTPVVWLNLAGTKITDAGLAHLKGMVTLERLHLERTAITDAGLDSIVGLTNLEYLNLYGTAITDAGLQKLAALKKLKKLYLWQTKTTPEGVAALKQALPELKANTGAEMTPKPPATPAPAAEPEKK